MREYATPFAVLKVDSFPLTSLGVGRASTGDPVTVYRRDHQEILCKFTVVYIYLERHQERAGELEECSDCAAVAPCSLLMPRLRLTPLGEEENACRILLDMPCKVCLDHSSGKHYGIFACDGCAGFFKRSIRRNRQYVCKARGAAANGCPVDKTHRNQCRACRLRKCLEAGMNREAVQHERGPRNSTIRRQVALYFKEGLRPAGLGPPVPSAALTPGAAVGVLSAAGAAAAAAAAASVGSPFAALHPALLGSAGVTPDAASSVAAAAAFYTTPSLRPLPGAGLCHPTPKYPYEFPNAFPETICEAAARLLFMNVRWMKHVTALSAIPMRDQVFLLEEGWREMFVLSAAQFNLPLEVAPLLAAA
ncbi:hypothetical protein MTO96_033982, partial [Rhipicephalus appendiculatus]